MIDTVTENKDGILDDLARRSLVVDHLPFWFSVHINEPCNQKCIMCVPTGNHGSREMPFEGFVELFDQIKLYAEHITLIGGEPLLYPHIDGVLDLLAEYPVAVTINTNGTMINDRLEARLFALHELNLKWSIDAAERDTYLRIRGRDHFNRSTERLRRFAQAAVELEHVHVIPIYVVMRENLAEVVPFVDFAASMGIEDIQFHPVRKVASWVVENGTGWTFDGKSQVCESFSDEFNETMRRAEARGRELGVTCDIHLL